MVLFYLILLLYFIVYLLILFHCNLRYVFLSFDLIKTIIVIIIIMYCNFCCNLLKQCKKLKNLKSIHWERCFYKGTTTFTLSSKHTKGLAVNNKKAAVIILIYGSPLCNCPPPLFPTLPCNSWWHQPDTLDQNKLLLTKHILVIAPYETFLPI